MSEPGKILWETPNVLDRRNGWIGPWLVEALVYDRLTDDHVGRTVIWHGYKVNEAGTLSSYRNGLVFVLFGSGGTAAGCNPNDLVLGVRPIGGQPSK